MAFASQQTFVYMSKRKTVNTLRILLKLLKSSIEEHN
nr:MAG TPA: hypothetical protein [Caudoviricetes sp.]